MVRVCVYICVQAEEEKSLEFYLGASLLSLPGSEGEGGYEESSWSPINLTCANE